MLIEFTVGNFRSIKDPVTLSMAAAKLNSQDPQVDINNTFQVDEDLKLLTSAAIYGANASGKSNLVKALNLMRSRVLQSSKEPEFEEPIDVAPFLLNTETETLPSFFEAIFLIDMVSYRYGFEITQDKVVTEWLFYSPRQKEAKLFIRDGSEIVLSRDFKEGKSLIKLTRQKALFLSVAAQFNGEISIKIVDWFRSLRVISGLDDQDYRSFTANKFVKDEAYRVRIIDLMRNSDVGIDDILVESANVYAPDIFLGSMSKEKKARFFKEIQGNGDVLRLKVVHQKMTQAGISEAISFDLLEESQGTQKLFFLAGPVTESLINGSILVIDEVEARIHTLLTRKLINLFNSTLTNPKHAQLIFATHDTNLLSNRILRRDQLWFVEKDEKGASHLYSLAELKVRNDASFESDYMQGKYGAIPLLVDMRRLVIDLNQVDSNASQ